MLVADVTGRERRRLPATSVGRRAPSGEPADRAPAGPEPLRRGSSSRPAAPEAPGPGLEWAPEARSDQANRSDTGAPPDGPALLDRLRMPGRPRPPADPSIARRLARRLDEGLADIGGTTRSPTDGPVVVTKARLARVLSCPAHGSVPPSLPLPPTMAMACGAIVDAVFRQLVTLGRVAEPMADGLAALRVGGHHDHLLAWIADRSRAEWSALAAEVEAQTDGLRRRWPRLDPTWLPRTQEPLRVQIGGGAFELSTRIDLALGVVGGPTSSVAFVEVKAGARHAVHREDLRFAALIEALRHPAPPFAVATYYTSTGELDVEWVDADVLTEAADRTVAGARLLWGERFGDGDGDGRPAGLCAACTAGGTGGGGAVGRRGEPLAYDRTAA